VDGLIAEIAKVSAEQLRDVERVKEAVARMKPNERADAAESADAPAPEPVNAADAAPNGRRNPSTRQKRCAAFTGQRAFSSALALWAPMRAADAEEAVTIENIELLR